MPTDKEKIIDIFEEKIKGKRPETSGTTNPGREGLWIERQYNIRANSQTNPDFFGYEFKKSSVMTSLFEQVATEYLFSKSPTTLKKINGEKHLYICKNTFIRLFGKKSQKTNKYNWIAPKYNEWNECGQSLIICPKTAHLYIVYSYKKDTCARRSNIRNFLIPDEWKKGYVCIAYWDARILSKRIHDKFNQKGFVLFQKQRSIFRFLHFGKPFTFKEFIKGIKNKQIVFDSNMIEEAKKARSYSKFRVKDKEFLTSLIYETVT